MRRCFPGDVIVGDGDGVIVIPAHLADEIADEAVEMTAFEDFVTEKVREGPLDPRPLSADRCGELDRIRRMAGGQGPLTRPSVEIRSGPRTSAAAPGHGPPGAFPQASLRLAAASLPRSRTTS